MHIADTIANFTGIVIVLKELFLEFCCDGLNYHKSIQKPSSYSAG